MMTETVVTVENAPNNNAAKPSDSRSGLGGIKINIEYFKTVPGIIKIVELILGILCMSLASPAILGGTHWFLFVATTSFIATLIWVFIYFLGIREALNLPIDWLLTELLNTSIATLLYTIAFIVQIAIWSPPYHYFRGVNLAAGVFGLFNTLAYGFGAYLLYKDYKSSRTTN